MAVGPARLLAASLLLGSAQAAAQLPTVTGAAAAGTLVGTVTLGGTSIPSPTRVLNSTDPEVCGTEHSLQDMAVSAEDRGIRWVTLALAEVAYEPRAGHGPRRILIDNRDCQFVPHVAVATVGDTVVARNSDATLHNTHYYGPMRSNIALVQEGLTASRPALRTGLVTVLCDVHGWMKAYIRIDPHPFHAVTDSAGRFRIEGVPPGTYALEVWHEALGMRQVEVTIEEARVTTLEVEYPAPAN